MFIVFEGIDACGKSTQAAKLAAWLTEQGRNVFLARDPGTTPAGNAMRQLVLDGRLSMQPMTQMLLFTAARSELACTIKQKLVEGYDDVVCDRWLLSTLVYQGHVSGISRGFIDEIARTTNYGLQPDATILIDVDPVEALRRREQRPVELGSCSAPDTSRQYDRMEMVSLQTYAKRRDAYLAEHTARSDVFCVDGLHSPAVLHDEIRRVLSLNLPIFATLTTVYEQERRSAAATHR